ncbi:hypothetical protein D3C74_410960 [compost metagenome]
MHKCPAQCRVFKRDRISCSDAKIKLVAGNVIPELLGIGNGNHDIVFLQHHFKIRTCCNECFYDVQ